MPEPNKNILEDIQGNLVREYPGLGCAKYLLYRWETPQQGRGWLKSLRPHITPSTWPNGGKPDRAVNIAFTYQGLNALSLSPGSLASFSDEFKKGMAARASILGDYGENDPSKWQGVLGSTNVHALVLVHGATRDVCNTVATELETIGNANPGVIKLFEQDAGELEGGKEHFGFKDGISQPWIDETGLGIPPSGVPAESVKAGGKQTVQGWKPLEVGEFLLGYKDESGRVPPSPLPEMLGKNGTYLVFRKISKNVQKFKDFMEAEAKKVWPGNPNAGARLGALMMGRWQSGCPVSKSPDNDNDAIGKDDTINNAFKYDDNPDDPDGKTCPLGAHIRRTNPREGPYVDPKNPVPNPPPEKGSHRHRMIRRGLHYEDHKNGGQDVGSVFIAVTASIERQFEFLQRFWVNNGEFQGLDRTDRDPVIGANRDERDPQKDDNRKFTMPGKPSPFVFNLPDFVTVRGGDYFFVPSLPALDGLATAEFSYPSFTEEYNALQKQLSDPLQLVLARKKLVTEQWLFERPKEMFDELRKKGEQPNEKPVFVMPGYASMGIPNIVIVLKHADVIEILRQPQIFTVHFYTKKMGEPRGPFILGMDAHKKEYQDELMILRTLVPKTDLETIAKKVGKITDGILKDIKKAPAPTYTLDAIQNLAWLVPVRLNRDYFGVSGPDEETAKRWMRDIYTDLFLNLRDIPEWTKAANAAVTEFNAYLDGLIEGLLAAGNAAPDTVLGRMVRTMSDPDPAKRLPKDFIRRNIFGVTVGVVETTLKAIARTIDQFLRRPDELKAAQQAIDDKDAATFMRIVWEAMRFNPQNHVVFRLCVGQPVVGGGVQPYKLPSGAEVPPGSLVFASTLSAMFDADKFPEPETFTIDPQKRPEDAYLFFGYPSAAPDLHQCLGRYISTEMIREVLWQVLQLKKLRRAKYDRFDPLDVRPTNFFLEFDA